MSALFRDYSGFYCNNLPYKENILHTLETNLKNNTDISCRFVHVTNIEINSTNFKEISRSGRLRWKIQNEGFNEQKNGGYNLSHKFVRKSHDTFCNYYQCLQIAHIINQLNTLSVEFRKRLNANANESVKSLFEFAISALFHADFDRQSILSILRKIANLDINEIILIFQLQNYRQKRKPISKLGTNVRKKIF